MLPITPFPNGEAEDSHLKTKDRVAFLVSQGLTTAQIAAKLGVSKGTVCFHKRTLGVDCDPRFARRYDWAEIRAAYDAGMSMRDCQREFGFSNAAWNDAVQRGDIRPRPRAAADDDVFIYGGGHNRFHLKRRLIANGHRDAQCEECGLSEWRGDHLPLELHHVNGDRTDNRMENLQLLCPNCHSLTDTWGGRAKRKSA